jgi:hypothetical protein
MSASGVPESVIQRLDIASMKTKLECLSTEVTRLRESTEELGRRIFDELPKQISDTLTANLRLGASSVAVTAEEMEAKFIGFEIKLSSSILTALMTHLRNNFPTAPVAAVVPTQAMTLGHSSGVFIWKDKPHMVPESFRFPRLDIRQLFDSWWGGYNFIDDVQDPIDPTKRNPRTYYIGPLCKLDSKDLTNGGDSNLMSKAKKVMSHFPVTSIEDYKLMSEAERTSIFETTLTKFGGAKTTSSFVTFYSKRVIEETTTPNAGATTDTTPTAGNTNPIAGATIDTTRNAKKARGSIN